MRERALGPYRLVRRIASGGMAEVYEARRTGPGGWERRVALKCILPQHRSDADFVAMFGDEARIAARLEHPAIVQVFDFGELDGTLYLAMELVDGANVSRLLRAAANARERVPLAGVLEIGLEAATALAYAHELRDEHDRPMQLVHRDVSPANLLVTRRGEVKLADFGIARFASATHRTDDGHVRGKLGYMSPEQVTGSAVDGRSDVFTLATVLAELRLQEPLFGTGTDLEILVRIRNAEVGPLDRADPARIPSDLRDVLMRALTRRPGDRLDARGFVAALTTIVQRRKLVGQGRTELSRLLQRLELVPPGPEAEQRDPVARPTGLVATSGRSAVAERGSDELLARLSVENAISYEVRARDGVVAGPYSYAEIIRRIVAGQIDPSLEVRREGEDGGVPELDRYLRSPARQWTEDELAEATVGEVEPGTVLALVNRIVMRRRTGLLRLDEVSAAGTRRKKIYFVDGKPEFATSTLREELLGEHLVRTGACLRMEVDMALAVLPRHGGRLGDALVSIGVLRPAQLFTAVRSQVRERYLEALRWQRGRWAFVPNARSGEETYPLDVDGLGLVRDGVLSTSLGSIETALASLGTAMLVPDETSRMSLVAYGVPRTWERTFDVVTGPRSVASWRETAQRRAMLPPDDVVRAIYFGVVSELVHAA